MYSAGNERNNYEIDISDQPKGIYFIQAGEGSTRRTKKIIVE
ncbi:MAG: T9SS type A sorting domain-containing protein [Bacteroidetes bacterium]|nr:T9SS type A sorting domain-containing protein [Bacteroidota bacterium]